MDYEQHDFFLARCQFLESLTNVRQIVAPLLGVRKPWRQREKLTTTRRGANESHQPAALRAGIKKRIGWHTFRHTYPTLIANGENVEVVQELMRHPNSRCTLDVYSQARVRAKRDAQQRIVEMILPEEGLASEIKLQRRGPDERLGGSE